MTVARRARISFVALLAWVVPALAGAQNVVGDTATHRAPVIRAVEIARQTVFDSLEAEFWLYHLVNSLHVRTRPYVIQRELLFVPGEPYDSARVNESERNLRALGIFQDVSIDTAMTDSGVVVRVRTIDAWTTTAGLGLSTSGSQYILDLSLQELNFLGTHTIAAIGYVNDPDRSSISVGVSTPRVINNRIGVGASYLDRSDGHAGALSLTYPFVSLSSRHGGSLRTTFVNGRVLRFFRGNPVPSQELRRLYSMVRGDAAVALMGSPRGYVRLGLAAQVRREDFGPDDGSIAIPRTITAAAGPTLGVRRPHYIRMHNYQTMGRVEDVDLGAWMQSEILAAPRAWGYDRDGVGAAVTAGIGHRIPSGFVQIVGGANALVTSQGTDSASAGASAVLVMQAGPRHLLVAHAGAGLLRNQFPGGEFDYGLGNALRAFPAHAFTGNREYQLHAEYRLIIWPRILGLVGVGVAAFVDHAGAWYDGQPSRTGTDLGVGLRLASLREPGSAWRFDLSRRPTTDVLRAAWVISVGRGFVFPTF